VDQVSLLDAQECVNLLTKATGQAIDVKFGVAINDQLSDEILVSVIASDFEQEIEFTTESTETFRATSILPKEEIKNIIEEDSSNEEEQEETSEDKKEEEIEDEDILPNFLKM